MGLLTFQKVCYINFIIFFTAHQRPQDPDRDGPNQHQTKAAQEPEKESPRKPEREAPQELEKEAPPEPETEMCQQNAETSQKHTAHIKNIPINF